MNHPQSPGLPQQTVVCEDDVFLTSLRPNHAAPLVEKPWISAVVAVAPEAEEVSPSEPRRRPLIYVYDVPPE